MPIKSFRAQIAHDTQHTLSLHTNNGSTGYRMVKLAIIPENPFAAADKELVVKIYKVPQTAQDGVVDFSDQTLLGVATYSDSDGSAAPITQATDVVIFDHDVFNQDLYITYVDKHGSQSANYYIELEQVKLALDENTVATLKDIRNVTG